MRKPETEIRSIYAQTYIHQHVACWDMLGHVREFRTNPIQAVRLVSLMKLDICSLDASL